MKILLTVDQGNSNPKVGIFTWGEGWSPPVPLRSLPDHPLWGPLQKGPEHFPHLKVIMSQVGKQDPLLQKVLTPFAVNPLIWKKEQMFLDMPFFYTPTIGDDRLFEAYYLYKTQVKNKDQKILIIDAGTFTTIDYLQPQGLQGGWILPGLPLMLHSYGRGANLPSLELNDPSSSLIEKASLIPHTTEEAILRGATLLQRSVYQEIFHQFASDLGAIYLTGGGTPLHRNFLHYVFKKQNLNIPIFEEEHLIHHALKFVFEQLEQMEQLKQIEDLSS